MDVLSSQEMMRMTPLSPAPSSSAGSRTKSSATLRMPFKRTSTDRARDCSIM